MCGGFAHQNLVEEVLDELFLERSRGEESMEIGAEQFRNFRAVSFCGIWVAAGQTYRRTCPPAAK